MRGVIALGDQLEQMQAARNALAESGTALYAGLARFRAVRRRHPGLARAARGCRCSSSPSRCSRSPVPRCCSAALANLRRAAEQQARQNERNQQAILRLLDELSSLADGDLTVQATVTEDITGAIADSINYAIEALRELVDDDQRLGDPARRRDAPDAGAVGAPGEGVGRAVQADRRRLRIDRARWRPRPRKSPATPSAPRTSRVTRSTSRTRAATPCAARSTA